MVSAAVTLASLAAIAEEVAAGAALQALLPGTRARKCAVVSVVRLCQEDVGYTDLRIAGEKRPLVCCGCHWAKCLGMPGGDDGVGGMPVPAGRWGVHGFALQLLQSREGAVGCCGPGSGPKIDNPQKCACARSTGRMQSCTL